ncbi:DUF6776 family protein [Gallaecimonas sp. GXIMD4217]|uniref:DUF6776 family protein n=1 Tax=Gallaecimonas sp. GXIMD4217 TaxID=3131927 RepID=UPI00311B0A9D
MSHSKQLLLAALAAVITAFALGRLTALGDAELRARLDEARTDRTLAEARAQVTDNSNQALRAQLKRQLAQLAEAELAISQYRRALKPQDEVVLVDRIAMIPEGGGAYRFHIRLLGQGPNARKGKLAMNLSGTLSGLPFDLDLVEASQGDQGQPELDWLPFEVRYLTELEGRVWLPESFKPQTLDLSIKVGPLPVSKRHIAWQALSNT